MADPDAPAPGEWLALNRANWDERVPLHLAVTGRAGAGAYGGAPGLDAVVGAEVGDVAGLRLLHLQCHFGRDTLALARLGAQVTGLDFSAPAIAAAAADAAEAGIDARFVQANVYDAAAALGETGGFDLVFVTWGTICWLPDVAGWARVVAEQLRAGGRLYFCDMHPFAVGLDDRAARADGRPGRLFGYFDKGPHRFDDATDYADPAARLVNSRTIEFFHTVADLVSAVHQAGMRLDWLHEHPRIAWQAFRCLVRDGDGLWAWPGVGPERGWCPLALSLSATKG